MLALVSWRIDRGSRYPDLALRLALCSLPLLSQGCSDVDAQGGSGGASAVSASEASGTGGSGPVASAASTTSTTSATGGGADLAAALAAIPGLSYEELPCDGSCRFFSMELEQPVDHDNPAGPTFRQRISLFHRDAAAPMVLASTGYYIYPDLSYATEPAELLNANQLVVEHRFFTPSRPEPADWSWLDIAQAAADHHAVVEAFRPIYGAPWIGTGASKGGMTSVYHRRFYPGDLAGTVAYVAPQSYGDADLRYLAFLDQVGDASCRAALRAFQVEVLSRRPAMLNRLEDEAAVTQATYTLLGEDAALDYAVIEAYFYFFQYVDLASCAAVPGPSASDDAVWSFLSAVSPPSSYSDEVSLIFEPYYYQAATELGYPAYDDSHLAGQITLPLGSDVAASFVFPEPTKKTTLDPSVMLDVASWLGSEGSAMLFVYGENDPYSAAAFEPSGQNDTYRFFAPGQNHGATIGSLTPADKAVAEERLSTWAGGQALKVLDAETLARIRASRLMRPGPR
jgi:hypothetical protein